MSLCLSLSVYGWGAASFKGAESQAPHDIPLAYSKGPTDVSLYLDIIDTETGTGITALSTHADHQF